MFKRNDYQQPPIAAPIIIPNPDPTAMTREKIEHDILSVEARIVERIEGLRMAFDARLNASDRAAETFAENLNRIPTQTDRQVGALEALHSARIAAVLESLVSRGDLTDEKFIGVDRQFIERDVRVLQSAAAATTAVNAALQAAKEAVGEQNKSFTLSIDKSETATMKQIDALLVTSQTATQGINTAIADVKERLTRIEGQKTGATDTTATQHMSASMTISIIGAVISAVVALIYVTSLLHPVVMR
ncbi:MAG: hypothetical protein NVSMB19_25520 [Vulcanimicrobiaceae bacterium]